MTSNHTGCPCTYTEPCHPRCACVSPASSRMCLRCCSYGSLEQRTKRAEILAGTTPVKKTKAHQLTSYMIKMRKEDYLKDHFTEVKKVVKWKCPICFTEYCTKTHAEQCLSNCRNRVLTEK